MALSVREVRGGTHGGESSAGGSDSLMSRAGQHLVLGVFHAFPAVSCRRIAADSLSRHAGDSKVVHSDASIPGGKQGEAASPGMRGLFRTR